MSKSVSGPIRDWQLQYLFERLVNILETSRRGPDTFKTMYGRCELSRLVLHDGGPLNLQDPAIKHLIDYADSAGAKSTITLNDLFGVLVAGFPSDGDGWPKAPIDDIHKLYALKGAGEWTEIDRLVRALTRYQNSFSEIIDPMIASFRSDPRDDGLAHDGFYALGTVVSGQSTEKVAFGTRPEYVLRFIDDVLQFAGDSHARDRLVRSQLVMTRDGDVLFSVPLQPKQKACAERTGYRYLVAWWSEIQWLVRDTKVLRALAAELPAHVSVKPKARFLEEDLGM